MNGLLHPSLLSVLILVLSIGCNGQSSTERAGSTAAAAQTTTGVGGNCDTCELMYIGMPASINTTDTSTAWHEPGQKLLVSGTVYRPDGKTPAPGIILYYWHTNRDGVYAAKDGSDPKVAPHGAIRGWLKTDEQGQYSIYTSRPGPYPGRKDPEHIHILVKEPDLPNEYYIDDIHFEGDPRLTSDWRHTLESRGGNGIVQARQDNGVHLAKRDIILGLNIPEYPKSR